MRMALFGLVLVTAVGLAQNGDSSLGSSEITKTPSGTVDMLSASKISEQAGALLLQAQRSSAGIATATLEKYPHHLTMLTVRVKSGGAEMHEKYADLFVALDGEAEVLTGGTIVDPKRSAGGEVRGAKVQGGASYKLHKGDILHIPENVPHQTTVPEGKTFTYYVVKIEQ